MKFSASPHLRKLEARIKYSTTSHIWTPNHQGYPTIVDIAESGFHGVGTGDYAKCWYCGGNIRYWKVNDDPWFLHAKHYPTCDFLLQKKGVAYVQNIVSKYPNIKRRITSKNVTFFFELMPLPKSQTFSHANAMLFNDSSESDSNEEIDTHQKACKKTIITDPIITYTKSMDLVMQLKAILGRIKNVNKSSISLENFDADIASHCIVDRMTSMQAERIYEVVNHEYGKKWLTPLRLLNYMVKISKNEHFCINAQQKCTEHKNENPLDLFQPNIVANYYNYRIAQKFHRHSNLQFILSNLNMPK